MNSNPFLPATKEQAHLRMALVGPAGSGKTYSALNIAQHLSPGGKVAVIDTEHGSARKYADKFDFDVIELSNFNPANYVAMINAAQQFGYDVLIIDSLSHAWNGTGGVLEIVDKASQNSKNNTYVGWAKGTPAHNALIDAILAASLHVIVTMRSKTDYVLEVGHNGKTTPRKVGTAPVQRDGVDYEFDVVGELTTDNTLAVTKTRCSELHETSFAKPGANIANVLRAWLSDGAEPALVADLAPQDGEAPAVPMEQPVQPKAHHTGYYPEDGKGHFDDGRDYGEPDTEIEEDMLLHAVNIFNIAYARALEFVRDLPAGWNWGRAVYTVCKEELGYRDDNHVKDTLGVNSTKEWDGTLGEMLISLIDNAPQVPEES